MEQKKNKGKISILAVMILLTAAALQMYGWMIAEHGYSNRMVQGYGEKVALAVLGLREGFFPWSAYATDEVQPVLPVFYHSTELLKAGYADISDNWGFREIIEYRRLNGETAFSEEFVSGHLMQHTLLEELLEADSSDLGINALAEETLPEFEFARVEDSYFADAVFIGDSRMVGVEEYAGIEQATFLAKISMTIYNMMDTKISFHGDSMTVREALTENQFGKVYIMVGINELGTADNDYFMKAYTSVIDEIRQLQPDAVIIIQGILHVTGEKDREDDIFNNANINARNEALKTLANSRDIFYIDVNEVYDDQNGNLKEDLSFDNVHLLGNCYGPWHDFLFDHGITY